MGKIVMRHLAAETLPPDLREGIPDGAFVTVTIEEEVPPRQKRSIEEIRAEIESLPKSNDDPVARIRALRDEWDR